MREIWVHLVDENGLAAIRNTPATEDMDVDLREDIILDAVESFRADAINEFADDELGEEAWFIIGAHDRETCQCNDRVDSPGCMSIGAYAL